MAARGNAAAVTAAAAAAARAGGRVRTGRSSDRLGGRCSVCHEHAVCAARARSGAGKRGGVRSATVGVGGAAVMWRGGRTTSARRTGRSSSASRAALKSRPSMGGEKPVGPRPVGGRTRFVSAFKSGFARSATLGLPRKAYPAGKAATGAAKFTPRGATSSMFKRADGGVAAGVVAVDWAEVSVMRHASEMRSRCSMQRRWRRGGFAGAPRRVLGCRRSVAGANRTASIAQGKE